MLDPKLSHLLLGKELKLLSSKTYKFGYLWEVEKNRNPFEVCPRCGSKSSTRAGKCTSIARDEPLRGYGLWLKIHKHRYYCKTCRKPFTETISLVWPRRRTTQRFRKTIARACENMTDLKRVRDIHKVSSGFLYKVFYTHIEVKLRERRDSFKWPEVLGIDEHFFRREKGFSEFVTVFTDVRKKRLFDVALGKNTKSLIEQMGEIPGRENVKVVVIDMSKTYRSLIKQMFPNAKIVADKFHVLRLLTPALIRTRKEIHGHRQDLRTRRQLLRNRMKLDYFERFDIDRYLRQYPELEELYRWKERLHEFYRTKGIKKATQAYEKMIAGMNNSSSESVLKLMKTFKTWRSEILEYFENRLTNAFTEQTNNRGKLVQKRGYGYKSFRNYRLRMLSACLYSGCAL